MASNQYSVSDNSDYPARNQGDVEQQVPGRSQVIVKFKPGVTPNQIEQNELPRRKQRGIRIKKASIVRLDVVGGTHSPDSERTLQSCPRLHVCPPYWQSTRHSKTPHPTVVS